MKQMLAVRWMHWKRHGLSLGFWLLFPLLATIGVTVFTDTLQDDAKVPVGMVMEDDSSAAEELAAELNKSPFMQMKELSEREARSDLKKHKLDSVFIIPDDFEDRIEANNRNRLVTAYQSDMSFAYTPVKEKVISHIQQATGRSKAAFAIQELEERYKGGEGWSYEAIKAKSQQIQEDEDLLNTTLMFKGTEETARDQTRLFPIWSLWAVFSLLSTLLVFDWVIKEKRSKAIQRLAFSRWSFKAYWLRNFLLYVGLLLLVDLITVISFYGLFGVWISLVNLIIYRLLLSMAAFLFAGLFKRSFYYYTLSFALTLMIGISSGAVLPSAAGAIGTWFDSINPFGPLLTDHYLSLWTIGVVAFFTGWLIRKERYHA